MRLDSRLFGAGFIVSGRFCRETVFVKNRWHVTSKLCALVRFLTNSVWKPVASWSSAPDVYGPGVVVDDSDD